jgi:hypothetical protein
MTSKERHDRNIRFFGVEGQERLGRASVAVVGVGGLGTHVVQQLSLLGVGRLALIDPEELDETNRNRYVGVRADDPVPGTLKVDIGRRLARDIDPRIVVETIPEPLISAASFGVIARCDYVFGCLDNDGARLVLTELCSAYSRPYVDLATEIAPDGSTYGGRTVIAWDGAGCAVCYEQLDIAEAQADLASPTEKRARAALYGVPADTVGETGPSVVSINGVVASLGVTEFMLVVSGVRKAPRRVLTYRAHMGGVSTTTEDPRPDCYYCVGIRGQGDHSNIQRYLAVGDA